MAPTVEYEIREPWLLPRPQDPDGGWTSELLDEFPEKDGFRYELVDGMLLVNASPVPRHQLMLMNLYHAVHDQAPPHLRVLPVDVDVRLGTRTTVKPDLLVVRREAFTATTPRLDEVPLLVAEVASRSTRRYDRLLKRSVFAEMGVPSYWLVDPVLPAITELRLDGDEYVEACAAAGEETFATDAPYPMSFVPARLLD